MSTISQANAAEREADRRIEAATQRVLAATQEAEDNVNQIKDKFQKQYENESVRNEAILESQRMKDYRELRDLQKGQQLNVRRSRTQGEMDLSNLQQYYRHALNTTEADGTEKVKESQTIMNDRLENERKSGNAQEVDMRETHSEKIKHFKEDSQNQIEKMTETNRKELETLMARYRGETQKVQDDLEKLFQNKIQQNASIIENFENKASEGLRQVRHNTSDKLAAYTTRQSDPFYKMMDLHAELEEDDDGFTLTAKIPQHEQSHVSASIKGDNLVLSGFRHNEEKLQLEEGHEQGSASFQSFHESFPLSWPVDASRLSKEFKGDQVIIRVPKKNEYAFSAPKTATPAKARVEHPIFPEDLPTPRPLAGATPRKPGSGTLA